MSFGGSHVFFMRTSTAFETLDRKFGSANLELKDAESAFNGSDPGFASEVSEFSDVIPGFGGLVLEFGRATNDTPRADNATPRGDIVRPPFPKSGNVRTMRRNST